MRGHPSHYQECYHDELTCNVNKVYMILLISIYVFLISMGLFPQLSSKEIIFQKKSYFFHNEKDSMRIRYIAVYLLSYVLHVYMILKPP